jgi:hypothetical protein
VNHEAKIVTLPREGSSRIPHVRALGRFVFVVCLGSTGACTSLSGLSGGAVDAGNGSDTGEGTDSSDARPARDANAEEDALDVGSIVRVGNSSSVSAGDAVTKQAVFANVGAGDALVAAVYWNGTTTTVTVADSAGNDWQPTGSWQAGATVAQIWYALDAKAGMASVTATASGSTTFGMMLADYSGVVGVDGSGGASASASTTSLATQALVTRHANDVILALFADSQVSSLLPGTGLALISQDLDYVSLLEDTGVSPVRAGSHTMTATGSSSSNTWVAAAIALRPR